jgi:hypothetical protein
VDATGTARMGPVPHPQRPVERPRLGGSEERLTQTFLEMNRALPEESRGGPINSSDAGFGDPVPVPTNFLRRTTAVHATYSWRARDEC